MPGILTKAFMSRNETPEFVGYQYLSNYLKIPTEKLRSSGMFDDIPYRYDEHGFKQFRLTAALDAIAKYKVTPPDNLHPNHEFSQAEAMLELGLNPERYMNIIHKGMLRTHISPRDGKKKVYRKEIDRFRRNWCTEVLISNMRAPVKRSMALFLLDIGIRHYREKLVRDGKIKEMPRGYRQPYRVSKAALLNYELYGRGRRGFRKHPLPDYLQISLAELYTGMTMESFEKWRMLGALHRVKKPGITGGMFWCYSKDELDQLIDAENGRKYYCDGRNYYTRKAVKYKFIKSDRWIDTFVAGKCRLVGQDGKLYPPSGQGMHGRPFGWCREDVERIVASGVECKIVRKRKPVSATRRKAMSMAELATPPVVFSSPVEQMEAAMAAAMNAEVTERKARRKKIMDGIRQESARLNAIRGILTSGDAERRTVPSRNDVLRFSDTRQIVTFLFSSTGLRGKYDEYPVSKDECLFRVSCGASYGRMKIPPSFARAICNALKIYSKQTVRLVPSWVVLVSATSIINDPVFHRVLESVPSNIGAVAPFGYGYLMPDGSWDRCDTTYGSYGMYSEITGDSRKVVGRAAVAGMHEVAMLDGPFVAIRGEYMRELDAMSFFQCMGDQRGFLGPIVSAICRKYGIPMMQVPVDSWSSLEFEARPGTPEMNLCLERIAKFLSATDRNLGLNMPTMPKSKKMHCPVHE